MKERNMDSKEDKALLLIAIILDDGNLRSEVMGHYVRYILSLHYCEITLYIQLHLS